MATYIQTFFTDIFNDSWTLNINDDTYEGDPFIVQGSCELEYPEVKTMDVIRGSQLNIKLEQSTSDTWHERIINTVGDKKLFVTLDKNGSRFWSGWIKADGIIRNYVTDYWIITLTAVCGLGLLENIEFRNSKGDPYTGNFNELELLFRCLQLTGQTLNVRQYRFNLYFSIDDQVPSISKRALIDTYVNTERFQKRDNDNSLFTAKEVLEGLLKKYGAFVTQQDNKWQIVRVKDYYNDVFGLSYNEYNSNGGVITENGSTGMQTSLGSQIDGFFPHHAQENQNIRYDAALGAYKVLYTYGFVKGILDNPTLVWSDATTIDNWTYNDITDFELVEQDNGTFRALFNSTEYNLPFFLDIINILDVAINSDITANTVVDANDLIEIQVEGFVRQGSFNLQQWAAVTLTTDDGVVYYLNQSGEWTLSNAVFRLFFGENNVPFEQFIREYTFSTTIKANALVDAGDIQIYIARPLHEIGGLNPSTFNRVDIQNVRVAASQGNFTGESHTTKRIENAVSIVDLTDKVYSGDNASDLYVGVIEDVDDNFTTNWSNIVNGVMSLERTRKLLEHLAYDRLTISGGNSTIFEGSVYGYLPYLGKLSINNIEGVYMTRQWTYDIKEGIIDAKHERIFFDDIDSDIDYIFSYETNNVVRPAIE